MGTWLADVADSNCDLCYCMAGNTADRDDIVTGPNCRCSYWPAEPSTKVPQVTVTAQPVADTVAGVPCVECSNEGK